MTRHVIDQTNVETVSSTSRMAPRKGGTGRLESARCAAVGVPWNGGRSACCLVRVRGRERDETTARRWIVGHCSRRPREQRTAARTRRGIRGRARRCYAPGHRPCGASRALELARLRHCRSPAARAGPTVSAGRALSADGAEAPRPPEQARAEVGPSRGAAVERSCSRHVSCGCAGYATIVQRITHARGEQRAVDTSPRDGLRPGCRFRSRG